VLPTTHRGACSPRAHKLVLDRVRRWAAATDPRIVRPLWPAQPDGAQRALCPGCGVLLRDGMLITLNQLARSFPPGPPPGPVYQALATGDLEALRPALPIEAGELWCVVCLSCLEDRALPERLHGLVDEALEEALRATDDREARLHPPGGVAAPAAGGELEKHRRRPGPGRRRRAAHNDGEQGEGPPGGDR
jgi:hypothetical protein